MTATAKEIDTVADLIAALQKCPQDAKPFFSSVLIPGIPLLCIGEVRTLDGPEHVAAWSGIWNDSGKCVWLCDASMFSKGDSSDDRDS